MKAESFPQCSPHQGAAKPTYERVAHELCTELNRIIEIYSHKLPTGSRKLRQQAIAAILFLFLLKLSFV